MIFDAVQLDAVVAGKTHEKYFSELDDFGKKMRLPAARALKTWPIKAVSGIIFTPRRDVLMTGDMGNRVVLANARAQRIERFVLFWLKCLALQAFEFNANGVVVAVSASTVVRCTGMPRSIVAAHQLEQLTAPANEKMRRHLESLDVFEIRMRVVQSLTTQKIHHLRAAINAWGQADGVKHNEINVGTLGALAKVWRVNALCKAVPTRLPQRVGCWILFGAVLDHGGGLIKRLRREQGLDPRSCPRLMVRGADVLTLCIEAKAGFVRMHSAHAARQQFTREGCASASRGRTGVLGPVAFELLLVFFPEHKKKHHYQ